MDEPPVNIWPPSVLNIDAEVATFTRAGRLIEHTLIISMNDNIIGYLPVPPFKGEIYGWR